MDHLMRTIKCFLALFLILQVTTETAVSATVYTVGENLGWIAPPNHTFYSQWASNKNFSVGDTLVFHWNPNHTHNVAKVSEQVYNSCSTSASSNQILASAPSYDYNLVENGSFYFICTVADHCARGQKLSIKIGEQSGGSPTGLAPSPNSPAPPSSLSALPPSLSYALILIYFLRYI
ncbi:hypothetical protein L6164_014320 [Bauhinia variegata]|uniref:Uncharacterized protein n=1 Tax=Bauhinia variegata TaxID=167791 RepID=A0ACB9NGW3_BAUVA|nr:hypothetical protein L6164_014320 [Bauhinia variegata]